LNTRLRALTGREQLRDLGKAALVARDFVWGGPVG
jgi:hypothetical protein